MRAEDTRRGRGVGTLIYGRMKAVPESLRIDSSRGLRRATMTLVVLVSAVAAAGGAAIYPRGVAVRFWVAATAAALVVAGSARRAFGLSGGRNVAGDVPASLPSGRLGGATVLTLARGGLISLIAGFLVTKRPGGALVWAPGVLYAATAIGDRCDGALARRLGQVTVLGRRLDVEMDALGLLVAPLVAVRWGRLPVWYLLLGAAYYLFAAGVWARRRWRQPEHSDRLRPNRSARFFAGVQMTFCSMALLPLVRSPGWGTWVAATAVMTPTLLLFARDWLIVVGRLPPPENPGPLSRPLARCDVLGGAPAPRAPS